MAAKQLAPADTIALTILQMGAVPGLYSGVLPSLWTIAHFSNQNLDETRRWIRKGEVRASALALGTGLAASIVTGSPMPLLGTIVMAGLLVSFYEHALNNGDGAGRMS
jgi:hypothetical protein